MVILRRAAWNSSLCSRPSSVAEYLDRWGHHDAPRRGTAAVRLQAPSSTRETALAAKGELDPPPWEGQLGIATDVLCLHMLQNTWIVGGTMMLPGEELQL